MATYVTSATASLNGTDDVTTVASGSYTPSGTNRAAIGFINTYQSVVTHTDYDFGATQATQVGSQASGNYGELSVWTAAGVAASSQTAAATWSATQDRFNLALAVFDGVDQTTPFTEAATIVTGTSGATATNDSITATGLSAGQLVICVAAWRYFNTGGTITANGDTWDQQISPTATDIARSSLIVDTATGSSHTFNVTFTDGGPDGGYYALRAFKVNDVSAGGSAIAVIAANYRRRRTH
jgi:hypothetical protein